MVIHFSIDDFIESFRDLTEKPYDTLFSHPVFSFLQEMHVAYGAVFSCYCFGRDARSGFRLEDVTQQYREEFSRNAHWLRFGFHGMDSNAVYGDNGGTRTINRDVQQAAADYAYVIKHLRRIVGEAAIDRIPRVHFFAGTDACCAAWKQAEYGILGLLTADDDRCSYYHDDVMRKRVIQDHMLYDADAGLWFFRTHIRLEREKDEKNLYESVIHFRGPCQIIFTHECHMGEAETRKKIELCAQTARITGKNMGFPCSCIEPMKA